jgi:hypothetical protein
MRNIYKILIGKPEGKRRPRGRWEDNIRNDIRETGWEIVDQIHLAEGKEQWRDVGTRREISFLAEWLLDSDEGDCSMELGR